MKIWQHVAVWSFYAYMGSCIALAVSHDLRQIPGYLLVILVVLQFVLGPLYLAALLLDVFRRFPKGPMRTQWTLLSLLLWPSTIYYYFAFARRPLPERPQPPPLQGASQSDGAIVGAHSGFSVQAPSSGFATASMVCGVVSLLGMCIPLVMPISIAGVVCGHRSMSAIRQSAGRLLGRPRAVSGLWMSYISLVVSTGVLALWIWMGTSIARNAEENSSKHLAGESGYPAAQKAESAMHNIAILTGQGNSIAAEALASDLGRRLVELQSLSFADNSRVTPEILTKPPIIYCHLEADSIVLLLRMRFPTGLSIADEQEYCRVIWDLFTESMAEMNAVPEGSRAAMALCGTSGYLQMGFGTSDSDGTSLEFVSFPGGLESKKRFYACFAPPDPAIK